LYISVTQILVGLGVNFLNNNYNLPLMSPAGGPKPLPKDQVAFKNTSGEKFARRGNSPRK
jgi:hypothetical protein